jgi:hypothetical protein
MDDLSPCLILGDATERRCAVPAPAVLQSALHAMKAQPFDKSRMDRFGWNDERPDWHEALRPHDGWTAYRRSGTAD